MNESTRSRRIRTAILGSALAAGCALAAQAAAPAGDIGEVWKLPGDLAQRDLFHGPGGRAGAPDPGGRFRFLREKQGGTQPGYDVVDDRGREWSVKQGVESRTEVTASRIVWAVGYHQPDVYYMPQWTLIRDGVALPQPGGRFRYESRGFDKIDEWSWRSNAFLGTRPMNGLFVLMVLLNNWDLGTVQNAVYEWKDGTRGAERRYMVRDLGATFGRTAWFSFATKDDVAGFEAEPFIRAVAGNRVRFHYEGAWREPQLHASTSPADVAWVCHLLASLSDRQWRDAFRAGGFEDDVSSRYIRALRDKVTEGLALGPDRPGVTAAR